MNYTDEVVQLKDAGIVLKNYCYIFDGACIFGNIMMLSISQQIVAVKACAESTRSSTTDDTIP